MALHGKLSFAAVGDYHLCFKLLNTVITIMSPQRLNCLSYRDHSLGSDILTHSNSCRSVL